MSKTSCMGPCPVFDLSINADASIVINAQQNLDLEGTYRSKLSESDFTTLIDAFEKSNFFAFEKSYTSMMTDLPTTTLTYRKGDKEHTVVDYDNAPEQLKALEARVFNLINTLNWEKLK